MGLLKECGKPAALFAEAKVLAFCVFCFVLPDSYSREFMWKTIISQWKKTLKNTISRLK